MRFLDLSCKSQSRTGAVATPGRTTDGAESPPMAQSTLCHSAGRLRRTCALRPQTTRVRSAARSEDGIPLLTKIRTELYSTTPVDSTRPSAFSLLTSTLGAVIRHSGMLERVKAHDNDLTDEARTGPLRALRRYGHSIRGSTQFCTTRFARRLHDLPQQTVQDQ
ncbi:hypothetical protein EXIGLDRAFT_174376 [Exidia glandulosa HHB12029]|uniref:Uncharacterized protein n=1 Tax=Exidia glandulosa HHB12029 TaxID=1314781 RepID=A0A165F8I0_EXIGL|nr:hypothetical protein EXIGLDRAFT_174376 [Exidia glandulosa HHB12029]